MDAPDVLVDAVAEVLWNGDSEPFISWANLAEPVKEMQRDAARRVLAVPAIADALRDAALFAEVREAWRACDGGQSDLEAALSQIMPPLYPETGKGEA